MSDKGADAVVAAVLSQLVGEYRGRDGKDLDVLARGLLCYGGTPAGRTNISLTARIGMKKRELTRADLNKRWEELSFTEHELACFPAELLADLIDAAAWPLLRQLVVDGPRIAVRKIEQALYWYSKTQVRPTIARPSGGTITRQTLEIRREVYRRVMKTLVALRTLEYPAPVLEPWIAVPPVRIPDAVPERTNRSAPPLDVVRAVVQRMDREIDERLDAVDGDKLGAIDAMRIAPLHHAAVAEMLRHLLTISLLATIAPRVSALAAVLVTDYDPQHRFPDGVVGPALKMYPGKTVHRDLARWKGLAPKEAALLKAHVLLSHRLYCERVPTEKKNSWKIPETPRTMPGGWALLAARLFKPDVPPNPQSLSNMLAGQATGYAKLPLPEFTGDLPRGRNGHSAHSMRHLGAQLVRLGIQRYCDENGIRDVRASAIADIVLDHDVREDRYGYADLNSEPGRERWVRIAACATSRLLWTDDGARRAPDVGAYEQALREGERLEDELRVLESRRATARRHRPSSVSEELSALREVVSLGDETEAVRQELEATRGECERLQGRDAWRVLHAGSPEDPAESDPQEALANTRRRVLDRPRAGRPRPRLARVREFLTVGEFAELWARSPASVRRLLSRNKQRARSWPFNLDVAPVDASRGPRRRRIWVGGVRADILERVPTAQLDRILSQDPQGWSASDVVAPLELPEPYATLFSGAPDRTTTPSGVHLKLVAENG